MEMWQSLVLVVGALLTANSFFESVTGEKAPMVLTDSGLIRGFNMNSRSGRSYYAFTKIPYAKPPLGPLRFKTADPDVEWGADEILDANQDLPDCIQIPIYIPNMRNTTIGTEDCLYLSVFTPKLGAEVNGLPVMVFIHGGGWRSELPAKGTQAPKSQFLMDEDIVLVMFHYRVGSLGFLTTEDKELPGNLGLKDQNLVLKWVKKNIGKFGGDSNKITIFGNSVGAASTHYHLISPLSKDLVQGGISQSGAATCIWAFNAPGTGLEVAKTIAKHLNCPEEPSEALVSCLRTKPAVDIVNAERVLVKRDFDPVIPFQPVIETGPDAFLTDSPYNLKIEKPWIAGFNSEDGAFKTLHYVAEPELLESFLKDGVDLLPEIFMYTNMTDDPNKVSKALLAHYKNEQDPSDLTNLWTDGYFTQGADRGMVQADGNAYQFLFAYRGKISSNDIMAKDIGLKINDLGVSHTDELLYLFDYQDEENKLTEEDEVVSKKMVKIWTDFAINGRPTLIEDWKPYKNEKNYLKISKHDTVEKNLWSERIQLWRDLPIRNKMEKMKL